MGYKLSCLLMFLTNERRLFKKSDERRLLKKSAGRTLLEKFSPLLFVQFVFSRVLSNFKICFLTFKSVK